MDDKTELKSGIEKAAAAVGSKWRLAKLLGVTPAAVYLWRRVPEDRIVQVEKLTGVDRTELRPDLYLR